MVNEFIQNDKLFTIQFTLYEDDRVTPIDLTNATEIKFKLKEVGSSSLTIDGTCTVTDATNGVCTYTVQDTELASVGDYYAEIQVTYNDGKVMTHEFDSDFRIKGEL